MGIREIIFAEMEKLLPDGMADPARVDSYRKRSQADAYVSGYIDCRNQIYEKFCQLKKENGVK